MTANQTTESKQEIFARLFLTGFAEALTSACGYSWKSADLCQTDQAGSDESPVRFALRVEGDISGEFGLTLARTDAILIASSMLQEDPDQYGEMESATLLELIQVAGERFRPENNSKYKSLRFHAAEGQDEFQSAASFACKIQSEDGRSAAITFEFGQDLFKTLSPPRVEEEESFAGAGKAVSAPSISRRAPEGVNLDLVMDVELNVTLRFGKRQLSLREVLELNTGSVLELDRQVDEPVELLLDGVVVARGEAVVIDGNYGLRVTEVAQHVSSAILHESAVSMQSESDS